LRIQNNKEVKIKETIMHCKLFSLEGKTAVVTGGNRGIGYGMAEGLAEHGADLVLVARGEEQLQKAQKGIQDKHGVNVQYYACDLRKIENIPAYFDEILKMAGKVDILLNNAGMTVRGPSEEFDIDAWQQVIQLNLSAAFAFSRVFCQHCKQRGGNGKILNTGSLMCHGGRTMNAPYAASKGGLLLLTRELAVEWAKYDIQVNMIGPWFYPTEMTAPLYKDEEFSRWVLSRTPMSRWGQPEDLVGAAVFLCSAASNFVTGQILYVDGGWVAAM